MKKIGIVTYWDTRDNYGTVLQNYALQSFLKSFNLSPELIRIKLNPKKTLKERFWNFVEKKNYLKAILLFLTYPLRYFLRKSFEGVQNMRKFADFQNKYLNMSRIFNSYFELKNCDLSYDYLVAGSDQIWNFYDYSLEDASSLIHTYFLDFADFDIKRVSCAASFGKDSISENHIAEIKPLIQKFDFVSVREDYGINLCKKLGINNAVQQYDPTFLLDSNDYSLLADSVPIEKKRKYVLLYLLSNQCDINLSSLYKWAKNKKLDVIYVTGNDTLRNSNIYPKNYPSVEEWLNLIKNAEYVFTNSFHGTIFCIKFNKQFLTIPQTGRFNSQNARIISLLEKFNLQKRLFLGSFDAISSIIDYNTINTQMKLIQEESPFVKYIKDEIVK